MEHKFYTDDFERLLKEKSDEFRMYPSKRVWHSIYNDLHPGRKWPSIAICLVLISALFFVGYFNSNTKQQNAITIAQHNNAGNLHYTTPAQNSKILSPQNISADFSNSNVQQPLYGNAAAPTIQPSITSHSTIVNTFTFGITKTNTRKKAGINSIARVGSILTTGNKNKTANSPTHSPVYNQPLFNGSTATYNSQTQVAEITEAATAGSNIIALSTTENKDFTAIDAAGNEPLISKTNNDEVAKDDNGAAIGKHKPSIAIEDKAWVDEYAFYNKPARKKWKGRIASEIYITPGVGYRSFTSNTNFDLMAASAVTPAAITNPNYIALHHKPGLTVEVGAGIIISAAKNIRIKAGLQANFTNYAIEVATVNHPVSTTIMLNDVNSGYPYLQARTSANANSSTMPGFVTTQIHNQTQQISLPVGVAVKLAGNKKIEWYAGASVQPTYIFGGKANLISADHKNYISEASMLRKWNVNTAFETYFQYKLNAYTLQFGPQFRHQLASTYSKQYTYTEKLYNIGMKIGLVKNF